MPGEPIRRQILLRLRAQPATVGQLARRFPVSRPAVSRHLATLQRAGLVETGRTGPRGTYTVRIAGLAPVREFLDGFWDEALARLEALAEQERGR
ncbi:MAG: winged helix-turn-helix domain-containing protein [Kofleriaceae bacterium]